jgi:hypothetical protein
MLKVGNQLLWRREYIRAFLSIEVPVISFSDLVVVAQNAFSVNI